MRNSFCFNLDMNLAVCHDKCQTDVTDYSYSFNSIRYSVLDHFLLSGTLYSKSVDRVTALHLQRLSSPAAAVARDGLRVIILVRRGRGARDFSHGSPRSTLYTTPGRS